MSRSSLERIYKKQQQAMTWKSQQYASSGGPHTHSYTQQHGNYGSSSATAAGHTTNSSGGQYCQQQYQNNQQQYQQYQQYQQQPQQYYQHYQQYPQYQQQPQRELNVYSYGSVVPAAVGTATAVSAVTQALPQAYNNAQSAGYYEAQVSPAPPPPPLRPPVTATADSTVVDVPDIGITITGDGAERPGNAKLVVDDGGDGDGDGDGDGEAAIYGEQQHQETHKPQQTGGVESIGSSANNRKQDYGQNDHNHSNNVLPVSESMTGTFNINSMLYSNIMDSDYFRVLSQQLSAHHEVIHEVRASVSHVEPWQTGTSRIPSTAFCLLVRLMQLRVTRRQLRGMLTAHDFPLLKALGLLYLRYTCPPRDLWSFVEPLLEDNQELLPVPGLSSPSATTDGRDGRSNTTSMVSATAIASPSPSPQGLTVAQFCEQLLTDMSYHGTQLPRIPVPVERRMRVLLLLAERRRKRRVINMRLLKSQQRQEEKGRQEQRINHLTGDSSSSIRSVPGDGSSDRGDGGGGGGCFAVGSEVLAVFDDGAHEPMWRLARIDALVGLEEQEEEQEEQEEEGNYEYYGDWEGSADGASARFWVTFVGSESSGRDGGTSAAVCLDIGDLMILPGIDTDTDVAAVTEEAVEDRDERGGAGGRGRDRDRDRNRNRGRNRDRDSRDRSRSRSRDMGMRDERGDSICHDAMYAGTHRCYRGLVTVSVEELRKRVLGSSSAGGGGSGQQRVATLKHSLALKQDRYTARRRSRSPDRQRQRDRDRDRDRERNRDRGRVSDRDEARAREREGERVRDRDQHRDHRQQQQTEERRRQLTAIYGDASSSSLNE